MSSVLTRKRGNYWEYRFEGLSTGGKRKQFSKCGFRTKKDALDAGIKAYNEYKDTGRLSLKEISVSDYLDLWFNLYVKTELSYNTQLNYLGLIENHYKPAFGDYSLRSLSSTPIIEYMNALKISGYSQSMLVNVLRTFSCALDYAIEPLHYISFNPASLVKMPKSIQKKEELVILNKEDKERIFKRFENTRFFIVLALGYFCGLRISEACGLTWDCVDFEKREMRIEKQILERGSENDVREVLKKRGKKEEHASWFFASPKKESFRTIKFGQTLFDILKELKEHQTINEQEYEGYYTIHVLKNEIDEKGKTIQRILSCSKAIESSLPRIAFVCIDENGALTTPNSIKYASRVINKELGIKFNYHALRHTHATELIEAGVSPKSVQTRLGHKNIETTLNTYVHDTELMKDDAVSAVEESAHAMNFLWSKCGQNAISDNKKQS